MKNLSVNLTLIILFSLSALPAQILELKILGNAITKNPQIRFNLTINGIKDSAKANGNSYKDTVDVPINVNCSIPADTFFSAAVSKCFLNLDVHSTLYMHMKNKGFFFKTYSMGLDSTVTGRDSIEFELLLNASMEGVWDVGVTEMRPKITTFFYSNSLLQWTTDPSTIIDSQSLWISQDKGATYKRIDTINETGTTYKLYPTQTSYIWTISPGATILKLITSNADSSDSSFDTLSATNIKNKPIYYSILQKTSSALFNAQGQLIYKTNMKSNKFSSGEYFSINKSVLLK